jgi:hypothetical protein
MAERFGGKFSPENARRDDAGGPGPATRRSTGRANVLFFVPFLYAATAFRGEPRVMLLGLLACGFLLLAAWLTHEGIKAQDAYDLRKVARRPAIPRKIFAAVALGVGLGVGGMISQQGVLYPLLFAIAGAVLHMGAFGLDPLADKGMEGVDTFQVDRVAKAVTEAENLLAGMKDAILRAQDRALETRVEKFCGIARNLFRSVENDPGDLTAARKYLSVYLMGARDATVKFADAYAQGRDAKIRSDYEALLGDLETTFAERTQSMLSGSHTDLDVEIQVLRDRLKLET